MARYIDADKLNGYEFGLISPKAQDLFHKIINNAPTADVKPIVYCKDCKFQDDIKGCIRLNVFVDKNTFYCEYGMRKEQENDTN